VTYCVLSGTLNSVTEIVCTVKSELSQYYSDKHMMVVVVC